MNVFLGTFQKFSSQNSCSTEQLFFNAPLNHNWQLLNLLWPEPCRVMSNYGSMIQDIKKSLGKTLLNIFLTVKTKWSNVLVPKEIFNNFKF